MATRSVSNLLSRLSKAGFKRDFVRPAILPDWWEDSLESDASMLLDIELRVARFLGTTVAAVRDPSRALSVPAVPSAVLRKATNMDASRLQPAIHAARRVAEAVVRNMKANSLTALPAEPEDWRSELVSGTDPVTLERMVRDLWERGIPVIPMAFLPSPAFQGMAAVIEGRPIIAIGQRYEAPGRVGFFVAHEAGHIAAGDCEGGTTIVDEEEASSDSSRIEKRADRYATQVLLGGVDSTKLTGTDYRDLATRAYALQGETGAEAGALIFHWARQNNDFQTASMAVAALYQGRGARQLMTSLLAQHIDMENVPETDRALLGFAIGESESTATAG